MAAFQTTLNHVEEETGSGQNGVITPSHAGTLVAGREFDLPISQPQPPSAVVPAAASAAPSASRTSSSSNRPRPLSMPPQPFVPIAHTAHDDTSKYRQPRDSPSHKPSRVTNRILGDYTLSKTLGAGSMGKVKLATHNITGEKLAVKILPRANPSVPPIINGAGSANPEAVAKQASKDASKEIRTLREAALSMLLHHPYICGMREMIVHQHHYYMVFEYVNGGQMLDYIISHGRLRERVARKFARQIGSALEYCHRNNVVHRDLKIENILISHTGNIKIIDFGLSNLYDPLNYLATFCGSLYFAAPELLNAKVYTGPEVDVWSFGVVLYVLVCGKVPFDDQSMPALHAKIKRGLVEYPVWLSAECKHLLARMLVTNPANRASLAEVLNHPWMCRGFKGAPDPHLLHREPLRVDELDQQVIRCMTGFEFGSETEIEQKLIRIIESDSYQRAVQFHERRRDSSSGFTRSGTLASSSRWGESVSYSSLATSHDGSQSSFKPDGPMTPTKKSKRFSGFDYYRRKFFSSGSPPGTPSSQSPSNSQSQLFTSSDVPADPTRGFHPLVSMYYLAREKLERERVYGPGHFASSQLSLQEHAGDLVTSTETPSTSAFATIPRHQPGSKKDKEKETTLTQKVDYNMFLPRLPAPETLHYSGMSYDTQAATPSPTSPAFLQPRPRDAGVTVAECSNEGGASAPSTPAKAGLLPRAPPASTHRRSHSLSQRPNNLRGVGGAMVGVGDGDAVGHDTQVPQSAAAAFGTFAEKQRKEEPVVDERAALRVHLEEPPSIPEVCGPSPAHRAITPPLSAGATLVRRFGSLLVGKGDDGRRHGTLSKRVTVLGLASRASEGDAGEKDVAELLKEEERREKEVAESSNRSPKTSVHESQSPSLHRRAATILDPSGRTARHERRGSTGATLLGAGTTGRIRRPSTANNAPMFGGRFAKTDEEEVAVNEDRKEDGVSGANGKDDRERHASDKDFKPVFLKGIFSVATTSTKSPAVLKVDIRRVLDRMQVKYRETKTGYECIHLPSIDASSIVTSPPPSRHNQQSSNDGRRLIVKKVSKLSFRKRRDKDREHSPPKETDASADKEKELPSRPSGATTLTATPSSGSSSFFNVSNHTVMASDPSADSPDAAASDDLASPTTQTQGGNKHLPPIPHDFAAIPPRQPLPTGEVDGDVFETISANMLSVRFEINIVKVPWLPLHGIQFRRASGDGWQYQMLARRVLTELKL